MIYFILLIVAQVAVSASSDVDLRDFKHINSCEVLYSYYQFIDFSPEYKQKVQSCDLKLLSWFAARLMDQNYHNVDADSRCFFKDLIERIDNDATAGLTKTALCSELSILISQLLPQKQSHLQFFSFDDDRNRQVVYLEGCALQGATIPAVWTFAAPVLEDFLTPDQLIMAGLCFASSPEKNPSPLAEALLKKAQSRVRKNITDSVLKDSRAILLNRVMTVKRRGNSPPRSLRTFCDEASELPVSLVGQQSSYASDQEELPQRLMDITLGLIGAGIQQAKTEVQPSDPAYAFVGVMEAFSAAFVSATRRK